WVEQDPKEILQSVYECIEKTCEKLGQLNIDISNIKDGSQMRLGFVVFFLELLAGYRDGLY
ncbi:hypothetical protein FD754_018449, partial [Muntiacus muntjak]